MERIVPRVFIFQVTLLLMFNGASEGAKILLLPLQHGSHVLTFQQIATGLAERGHSLHTVGNEACKSLQKLTKAGVINHGYKVASGCLEENNELKKIQFEMLTGPFSVTRMWDLIGKSKHLMDEEFHGIFAPEIVAELKEENFDIAIVDALIFVRALYILPHRLGIPVISIAAVTNLLDTGIPALPSFTPVITEGRLTNQMTFFQRVTNVFASVLVERAIGFLLSENQAVTRYAPEMPYLSVAEMQAQSALWLIMNDLAIDYPQVSLPHVVNIGGINTGPGKPLTGEFKEWADQAEDGLVVVSFGASLSDFPAWLAVNLYNDLRQVKHAIIWRYTGRVLNDTPSNIHFVDWLPQNDLLAHPNTKVFVTHCGCSGQFEALYHGVPMVGLPVAGDQKYNAKRMETKGMGIVKDLLSFQPGELASAINEVAKNESYRRAVKKYSAIFRSQPMGPMERAVYWIEHVLQYGTDHLRSTAVDMPWYQYWCIDVIFFVTAIVLMTLLLFVISIRFIFRKCRAFCAYDKSKSTTVSHKQKMF